MSLYALHVPSGATGAYHDATSPSFTSFLAQIPLFLSFELIVTRTSGTATATLHVEIDWKDKSGTSLTPFTSDIVIDATSQSLKKFQVTPPANAYSGTCYLKITPAASPMIHDVQIQNLRLGKTELAATLGADWSGNILNRPANLGSLVGSEVITNSSIGITSGVIAGIGTGNNTPVGNALVSIGSNGALAGGGGGQVTLPGIGFSGDTNATYGATWGTNVKAQPSIPDLQDEFNYPDVATCQLKWSLNVPANASMVNTTDTGGKALQIGDNAGNDAVNGIMLQGLPYITTETYELVWDVEIVAAGASSLLYLGVQALDAAGNNLGSSYNYVAAAAYNEGSNVGRHTFRAYMKGTGPVTSGPTGSTPDAPVVLPDGSKFAFGKGGTVTIKPIFLANFNGQPGQIIIHSVTLRRMRDWSTNLAGRPGELTDGRVANGLSAVNGYVDFSRPHIGKNLDNIGDGPTYGRPLISRLNGGKPLIDFSEQIHLNKSLANVDAPASAKLGGIAAGATVGATWGGNLTGTPGNLSALTGSETIRNNLISLNGVGQLTYDGTNTVSTSKLDNGLISIGSNGALTGGGGGQVTIGGLTPNGLDNIADGPTYAKIPLVNTFGSGTSRTAKIDFTLGHVGKGALATKDVVTPSLTTVPTGGNLNPDPKYSDTAGWTLTGNAAYGTFSFALPTDSANASTALTAMNASKGVRFLGDGATTGASTAYSGAFWNQFIPVIPGQVYRLGGKRYVTTPSASSTITTYVQCKVLLTDGTYVYPTVTLADSTVAGLSAVSGQVTMPANAVSAQLQCFVAAPAGTVRSYDIYFGELTLVQCSDWANTITSRPTNLAALSGTEGVNNALVSIGSNGALTGGGGGQVTIGGLGFTGDTDAQRNSRILVNSGILTGIGTSNVTVDNSYVPVGANLQVNSELTLIDSSFSATYPVGFVSAWVGNSSTSLTLADSRQTLADASYAFSRSVTGTPTIPTGSTAVYVDGLTAYHGAAHTQRFMVPVKPGDKLGVSALLAHQNCIDGYVMVQFWDENLAYVTEIASAHVTCDIGAAAFNTINRSQMALASATLTVPADVAASGSNGTGHCRWAMINTRFTSNGTANPRMLVAAPMLAKIPAGQTAVPPYQPGPSDRMATFGAIWNSTVTSRPANLAALAGSEGINNASVSIGSNGALTGGGGGQVTYTGIGGRNLGLKDTLGWGDTEFVGRPANLAALTGTEGIKNSLVPATDANRIRFSRMEGGTTGYAVYDNSAGTSAIDQNINAGKRYVHVSGNFTANGQAGSVGTQGVGAPTSPYAVPVTAGERLFVGAQVSSGMPNPGCTTILRVYFMDATGASTGSFDIFNGNGSDSMWTRRAGFCTVPANSVFCSIVYYALNNSLGITGAWNLYLAEPMICGATADQVTFPSFNAPLSGEFGATLGASWSGNVTARPANLAALAGSEGINNGLISIGANGAMSGGGGGQVTIHGITPNGLDDVADGTAFARVSAAELSGGVPKVTIKGSGKTVGDMRNIPVVGAAGGRYRFTGAISYSASPTVATITVGAGNLVMGSVTIPYNSMSLTINSSANAPISRTLYVDTNVTVAGAHTLKGVDPSDPAAIADVYGSDTVAIVGSISFTMPNSTTSSGGGTAWSGVGPAPSGGSIP